MSLTLLGQGRNFSVTDRCLFTKCTVDQVRLWWTRRGRPSRGPGLPGCRGSVPQECRAGAGAGAWRGEQSAGRSLSATGAHQLGRLRNRWGSSIHVYFTIAAEVRFIWSFTWNTEGTFPVILFLLFLVSVKQIHLSCSVKISLILR